MLIEQARMHATIGSPLVQASYVLVFGCAQYARSGYDMFDCRLSCAVEEPCPTPPAVIQTPGQPYVCTRVGRSNLSQ